LTIALKNVYTDFLIHEGGVLDMLRSKKVWVTWKPAKGRWEVGFNWQGRKYRKYSWLFEGQRIRFSRENKAIADEFANQVRAEMRPNKGVVTFNPEKYMSKKQSLYWFANYAILWLKGRRAEIETQDITAEYWKHLERYLRLHINPRIGEVEVQIFKIRGAGSGYKKGIQKLIVDKSRLYGGDS